MTDPHRLTTSLLAVALTSACAAVPVFAGEPNALVLTNGSGDAGYVRITDSPGLEPQQFTIDVVFRPEGPGSGGTNNSVGATIVAKPREFVTGVYSFSWTLNWSPTTNRVVGLVSNDGSGQGATLVSSSSVPVGETVRATFTFDGETIRLFLDGCLDAQVESGFSSVYYGDDDVLIGAANYGVGFLRQFDGRIDDLSIWDEALDESQINGLDPSQAGEELLGWWTFDGGSLADQSGNGHDGTAVQTVAFSEPIDAAACRPDLNADGAIDLADLNAVLSSFGQDTCLDATGDGVMDLADLNAVLANFGTSCP